MRDELEAYLWQKIRLMGDVRGAVPRTIVHEMVVSGMIASKKQAWRTLEKWASKGLYDYGIALDRGWRTQETREIPQLRNRRA